MTDMLTLEQVLTAAATSYEKAKKVYLACFEDMDGQVEPIAAHTTYAGAAATLKKEILDRYDFDPNFTPEKLFKELEDDRIAYVDELPLIEDTDIA